jgi:hypothetical protein
MEMVTQGPGLSGPFRYGKRREYETRCKVKKERKRGKNRAENTVLGGGMLGRRTR